MAGYKTMCSILKCDSVFCVLILCSVLTNTCCFNVDTINFVLHQGEPGSMFGFSVAQHKERGDSWLLIGAPEAQTEQPGVSKGGAVYRCDPTRDNACAEIAFDRTGNNNNSAGQQIDKKSGQWFGATVKSSGEDGVVMACAPRYVWFSTSQASRRDPVGTCYVARNSFHDFSEYSPCRTRNWGYHRQGSCQAGLGADVSKDGQRLYVGAPGSWYWQGQIYEIESSFTMPTVSPDYSKYLELNLIEYESGQLFAQNPNKRPEVLATQEGPAKDDDSYLGYSVASGNLNGDSTGGVAVGMPRGSGLLGKVVIYTVNLTNTQNITGEQLGAYFSYSLAVSDVDGDGLDDLIVGAPFHTDLSNNEGKYETGRIYVYYQKPERDDEGFFTRFSRWDTRDGKNSKARFGLSLCNLGDINLDGYGDFAVGAPYDGVDERGAVYVFHGSKQGVRETYSQVIHAESLSVAVTTFGFSLSGGLDLDQNGYPDMLVGAYETDTAMFFRSRPVVKFTEARINFNSNSKQINLEDKSCTLKDTTRVACLALEACLKYTGVNVARNLDLHFNIALDSKKTKGPRMFFLTDEGRSVQNTTIRLNKDERRCELYRVYIKPNVRDKLTPLESELRFELVDRTKAQAAAGRRHTRTLEPILDSISPNVFKDTVSIQKNCGSDNVCIPDLQLSSKLNTQKYVLGSRDRIYVDVFIKNGGEDAFEAMYNLQLPPGIDFTKIERSEKDDIIVQCSPPSLHTNNTIRCDIGNPFPRGRSLQFKVVLEPRSQKEGMKSSYEFMSNVTSTNIEESHTVDNNVVNMIVPIWVETDLILQGVSNPREAKYNLSLYEFDNITSEVEIGPQIVHAYNIRNKGPSNILEAETYILWPSYTLAGDHLLYLLEQPETRGRVKCEYIDNVNEDNIKVERKRKSYLENIVGLSASPTSGAISQDGGHVVEQSGTRTHETVGSTGAARGRGNKQDGRRVEGSEGSVYRHRQQSSHSSGGRTGGSSSSSWSEQSSSHSSGSSDSRRQGASSVGESVTHSREGGYSRGQESVTHREGGYSRGQESVTHREGGYSRGQESSREHRNQGTNFAWGDTRSGEERINDRRTDSERRRVTSGHVENGRGVTIVPTDRHPQRNNQYTGEDRRVYGQNELRTVTLDLSSVGSNVGTSNVNVDSGRNYDLNSQAQGGRGYDSSSGTRYSETRRGHDSGRSRSGAEYEENYSRSGYSSAGRDEGKRREQEGGSHHYSSEYESRSNSSWDSSRGGQPQVHSSSRWSVNDNGSVRSGSGSSYDEEYRRRLHEDSLRALGAGSGSGSEGATNSRYYNSSYQNERRYQTRTGADVDGYTREGNGRNVEPEEPGLNERWQEKQYQRQRKYRHDENTVQDEDRRIKSKRHIDSIPRFKRDIDTTNIESSLQCGPTNCTRIKCKVGPLVKDEEVWIALRGRVWVPTLKKIGYYREVKLSSLLVSEVTKLPYIGAPHTPKVMTEEVFTELMPQDVPIKTEVVPLWIVVLSACAGTIILLLLIFLLWKCGFFKRNRPDTAETQPLNKNGYHNGDEAL